MEDESTGESAAAAAEESAAEWSLNRQQWEELNNRISEQNQMLTRLIEAQTQASPAPSETEPEAPAEAEVLTITGPEANLTESPKGETPAARAKKGRKRKLQLKRRKL